MLAGEKSLLYHVQCWTDRTWSIPRMWINDGFVQRTTNIIHMSDRASNDCMSCMSCQNVSTTIAFVGEWVEKERLKVVKQTSWNRTEGAREKGKKNSDEVNNVHQMVNGSICKYWTCFTVRSVPGSQHTVTDKL